jgi:hypothetical protein
MKPPVIKVAGKSPNTREVLWDFVCVEKIIEQEGFSSHV